MDCYVFLCRYEVLPEEYESDAGEESGSDADSAADDDISERHSTKVTACLSYL